MKVSFYTHLPSLKTEGLEKFDFSIGSVSYPDFETWHHLDGTFAYSRKKYEKNKPLFFTGSLVFESNNLNQIFEEIRRINLYFYWAVTLALGGRLIPNPQMSCSYFLVDLEQGVYKLKSIGNFEREWIVFGDHVQYKLDSISLQQIEKEFKFLLNSRDFSDQYLIMQGFRTLQFTSNPDFYLSNGVISNFNGFVHCMSVLEAMLVPAFVRKKYTMSITEAFGKNAAVLSTSEFSDIEEQVPYYSEMYRIRSKMIHGEVSITNFSEGVETLFSVNRYLLTIIIKNLIALFNTGFDLKTLPDLLIRAFKDKETYEKLFSQITNGHNHE